MSTKLSLRLLSASFLLALIPTFAFPQSADDARALAEKATLEARAGNTDAALKLYEQALAVRPDDTAILRDKAVVLGWAGRYSEAIPIIKRVRSLESNQPDWALREFATAYLFGDATTEALGLLDELVKRGDMSEQTLSRRALALRWLGRTQDAQKAYRAFVEMYPKSADAAVGLAYSMADEGKTSDALKFLNSNNDVSSTDPAIMKAKIRLMNWSGRHYEAQTMIEALPPALRDDRDVLEDRIAAARWGGNPASAMKDSRLFSEMFPGETARKMSRDLRSQFGQSFSPSVRYSKDVYGLVDRVGGVDAAVHVTPAHVIRLGYQYRWQEQDNDVRRLVRYDLAWSGEVNRKLAFYAAAGNVDYRIPGLERKLVGDGSLAVTLNPNVRLTGGGGRIIMDAFQSIPHQVTAPFGFGDLALRFGPSMRLQTRYSHFSFSDAVNRDRTDAEFIKSFLPESRIHVSAGWRSSWMRHDAQTDHFWSPSSFHSHMAVAQSEGRLTRWLDYAGEVAAGWQKEPSTPSIQHPFQFSGRLAIHASRHWRMVLEAGRSTSSLDRTQPDLRAYSRWAASAGMEFRFP